MLTPRIRRDGVDACPGALRLHAAADGPLARVRVPGGILTGAQLGAVREMAERWGDGQIELTSRANLQLRALGGAPAADLAAGLRAAGLLPSQTHELVRNIAASPMTRPAGRALVADLDRRLCADPALAALPGRFLFALDDGTGDVAPTADVAAVPAGIDTAILFAGEDHGVRVSPDDTVTALLAAADAFLAERAAQATAPEPPSPATPTIRASARTGGDEGVAWRVRELRDGPARVAARTAAALGVLPGRSGQHRDGPAWPGGEDTQRQLGLIGVIAQPDGLMAVAALVPLGSLSAASSRVLEGAALLVLTPWRGVVVPDLPPSEADRWLRELAGAGLEVTAGSRWSGMTACAGRPGCAKALADVRHDARATVLADGMDGPPGWVGRVLPVHWVGCERGCGSPGGPHVRVEATGDDRYLVAGVPASAVEVGMLVAAARRD